MMKFKELKIGDLFQWKFEIDEHKERAKVYEVLNLPLNRGDELTSITDGLNKTVVYPWGMDELVTKVE